MILMAGGLVVGVGVRVLGREYFRCILVSVEVGLWKMLMLRQVGLLVIEKSRKWILFSDSIVGLSWTLMWIVSTYCRTLSGLTRVES